MSSQNTTLSPRQNEIIAKCLLESAVRVSYWDKNQICQYTNRAGLKDCFGKTVNQVIGHTAEEVFGDSIYQQNLPCFLKALAGIRQTFERKIVTNGGSIKYLLANYIPDISDGQVQGVIVNVTDITNQKELEQELKIKKDNAEFFAIHDYLTRLPNRVLLTDRIKQSISLAKRTKTLVSLMTLDIDDFKQINDKYGHQTGDIVLKVIAERLSNSIRESDTVSRIGGDEFLLITTQDKNITDILFIANRILQAVQEYVKAGRNKVRVSASIGIAIFPLHSQTARKLISYSDKALYYAKNEGKNRYSLWSNK